MCSNSILVLRPVPVFYRVNSEGPVLSDQNMHTPAVKYEHLPTHRCIYLLHMRAHTHTHTHIHTLYIHMHILSHTHTHTCTHTLTHTHTCMHMHTHTHTHTHTHPALWFDLSQEAAG